MHVPLHYRKVLRWLLIWNKYCGNIHFYWTPICVNFVIRSQSQFIVGMSTNRSLKLLLVCVYHFDIHVSALNIICLKKTLNCFANTYNWFHSMATLVAAQAAQCRTVHIKRIMFSIKIASNRNWEKQHSMDWYIFSLSRTTLLTRNWFSFSELSLIVTKVQSCCTLFK